MQNMRKTACERLHNMSQPERAKNVIYNLSKTVLLGDLSWTYSKPNDMFRDLRLLSRGKRRVNVYTTCLQRTLRKHAHKVSKTMLLETASKT